MTDNKPSVLQKERRLKNRSQIPKSLDAKVIVCHQRGAEDGRQEVFEPCCQGYLSNICERGVQIIVGVTCWKHLHPNQSIKLQLDIASGETEIKTEVIGCVRYIVPYRQDKDIKLGIEFSESGFHAGIKQSIRQIFKISEPCPECKFDECPSI